MKNNKYKNIYSKSLTSLDSIVNKLIADGCRPIGGVSVVVSDRAQNIVYVQTVVVDNENNSILGEFTPEPRYYEKVKELAKTQKLAAVKLFMEESGMDLKESKEWVDNNC